MKELKTVLLTVATSSITAALMLTFWPRPQPQMAVPARTGVDSSIALTSVIPSGSSVMKTVGSVKDAVVSVTVTRDVPVMERYQSDDSPFGMFQMPQLRQRGTRQQEVGGGTAFFVSSDGLLMTNRHVADDDKATYTVLLNDGRKLTAKVVATHPSNDIAFLKVDGGGFPFLEISQAEAQLGQPVIAIGNALGEFRNTVSVGVVSGLGRSITAGSFYGSDAEQLDSIIQTDAAINQGNSGGPLIGDDGTVIGMNTAVATDAQNIGFAIPASDLRSALASYREHGRIVLPYIGVRYMPVTKELKDRNKLDVDYGVLVLRGDTAEDLAVVPGSPADKAGIRENDIILDVDGVKLTEETGLAGIIRRKSAGDQVKLKVLSRGKEREVTVVLEEMKS